MIASDKTIIQITPDEQPTLTRDPRTALAGHIRKVFRDNRELRREVEEEMIEALRQRNGEYSDRKLSDIRQFGGSEIYLPLTTMQCVAASSLIMDIVLPPGRRAFSVEPTPEPEVPEQVRQAVLQQAQTEADQLHQQLPPGTPPPSQEAVVDRAKQLNEDALKQIKDWAAKAAKRMETKIADQLQDSGWDEALEMFVEDFVTFPTAFMKTISTKRREVTYQNGKPTIATKIVDKDVRVSPFDIYPSKGQTTMDDGDFVEKVRYSRAELYGMIGQEGYDEASIREILHDHTNGGLRDFEHYSEDEQEDAERQGDRSDYDSSIEGGHYWGMAQGRHLIDWGIPPDTIDDEDREYRIDAILIGDKVIRASLDRDPLQARPYYMASYRNRPGSFWGFAPPWLMRHHQDMCNATARSLANNMGIASGPQIMMLVDRLPKGQEITSLHPLKIWQMISDPTGNTQMPVQFFQPTSNAEELLGVLTYFWEQVSDVTGIHRITYGGDSQSGGVTQTFRGASLLIEQASKPIKSAVRHLDDGVIKKRIKRQYDWNMLYDADTTIKGDAKVVAVGSKTLAVKSAQQAARNEFLSMTANPVDMQVLGPEGRGDLLRQTAADMELELTLKTPEQIAAEQAQQAEQAQADPRIEAAKIQAEAKTQVQEMEMMDEERDRALQWQIAQLEAQREELRLQTKKEQELGRSKTALASTVLRNSGERQKIFDKARLDDR